MRAIYPTFYSNPGCRRFIPVLLLLGLSQSPLTANEVALQQVVQNASELDSVDWNLRVDCVGPERIRSMSLIAGEVGVWDLKTQVDVAEAGRRAFAQSLLDAKFFALEREYGGNAKPDSAPPPPAAFALRVICRVEVESVVDGERIRRSSVQYADGEQSAELAALANGLLDQMSLLAKEGVQPDDFADVVAHRTAARRGHQRDATIVEQGFADR